MRAVDDFLKEEKRIVNHNSKQIDFISPFKKGEKINGKKI